MPLFSLLFTNVHFQEDFLNKLYMLSTFSNISLPFHEVQLFDVNQNLLARALKNTFAASSDFFFPSLH